MNLPMRNRIAARRGAGAVAAALALALVLASSAPGAETGDRDKPISFAGDTGDANLQARGGALAGNVLITQGTLSIRADRIVFKQNADNSLSATAYGNPVAIRQKRDGVDEYYEGYAQRVEYDGSKELFKAEGRASTVPDPTGPGARVRGMFQPRSGEAVPGKSKDGAKAPAKEPAREPAKAPAGVTLQPAGDLVSPAAK